MQLLPYNTFKHTDLPPGPINSPGLAAIKAFLHPASSSNDWTYFCTVNKKGLTALHQQLGAVRHLVEPG